MNKNLDSPTKLTEFAPLSPEEKSAGVGYIFSRFFKRGSVSREASPVPTATGSSQATAPLSSLQGAAALTDKSNSFLVTKDDWRSRDDTSDTSNSARESTASLHPSSLPFPIYADIGDGRSLPNVLKRISNLIAMKSNGLQAYKDTDFKQYWMPDSVSKECYDCGDRFTTFRRRHHCRVCGQIFCSRCCNQEIPGKIMGCTGDLRVCTYCCKVVLSYLQSADICADLSADMRALQEDLQSKFGDSNTSSLVPPHISGTGTNSSTQQTNPLQSPIEATRERCTRTTSNRRKHSYQEDRFAMGRSGNLASPSSYLTSEELQLSAEERWQALQGSSSLRALWEYMKRPETGVPLQSHRYRLRNFPACFVGTQLVDWLVANNRAATTVQAVALGQALIEAGYMECISHIDPVFQDGYALYRLRNQPASGRELSSPPSSPPAVSLDTIWTKHEQIDTINTDSESESCEKVVKEADTVSIPSSGSTFYLDLDVQGNHVQLRRTRHKSEDATDKQGQGPRPSQEFNNTGISREFLTDTLLVEGSDTRELVPSMGWHRVENLRTDNGENEAYIRLTEAFDQHQRCLLQQLLSAEGLSRSWGETISSLVQQIVELVRPDVKNDSDDMDIRQYVQFKKVSGGGRSECNVVSGVVCTKNVAHRSMQTRLTNPRILLLGCSIIYERVEGRFLSLEPLIMQEQDYLKNAVARIVSLQPDLVLVEKTVSRLAQDLLLDQGITLALNMKQSVLERLSRLTQADILTCVDAHVGKPRLGMCHNFFLRTFQLDDSPPSAKTLMFFDGCATHLGCTVILRGGSAEELRRVKKVLGHLILVHYSWRLEKSFLMDEFAMPPSVPVDSFFADDDLTKEICDTCTEKVKSCETIGCSKSGGNCGGKRKLRSRAASREKGSGGGEDIKIEAVVDQSDPLHQYLAGGSQGVGEEATQLSVATLPLANRFRKALDGTVLSSSPYLQYVVPFLETEAGRQCALRRFFPEQVFWSPQFDANSNHTEASTAPPTKTEDYISNNLVDPRFVHPCHNFVNARLTKCLESWEVQALLASFRASGGCLRHPEEVLQPMTTQQPAQSTPVSDVHPKWPQQTVADSLSSLNHQRLTVLFCSFSHESNNAPAFCVNPWVVHMELYGRNDIPLGQFLQHYCFRKTYTCPSPSCSTPMLRHIRRFVHDACCVQVTLKELDSQIPVEGNAILMWSWCSVCKLVSPVVPMSVDTWSLSFAKYLELRFHGQRYSRRGKDQTCPHSLHHTHYQYFGFRDIVASFKLTSVALWEISLPADRLLNGSFSNSHPQVQTGAIEEVKHLSVKGYEVFAAVSDKLCQLSNDADSTKLEGICSLKTQLSRDKVNFKSKIEEIQLKLTSPTLEAGWLESSGQPVTSPSDELNFVSSMAPEVSQRLWDVEDCLVQLKRMIAEAVTVWNSRLGDITKSTKKSADTLKVLQSYSVLDSSADEVGDDCEQDAVDVAHTHLTSTESADSGELLGPCAQEAGLTSSSETADPWPPDDTKRNSNSLDVPDETCEVEVSRGHERSQSDGAATSNVPPDNSLVWSERRSIPQVPPATAVKHIFSQLLPLSVAANLITSPLSGQEHPLLPLSLGPNLVVYENEPSSIIAYTLCSAEYHRKLTEARQPAVSTDGPPPSPIELKRKSQQDTLSGELLTSAESTSSTRRTMLSFLRGGSPNLSASRHIPTPRHPTAGEYDGVQYTAGSSGLTDEEPPTETNNSSVADKTKSVKNSQVPSEVSIDVHFSDSTTAFHCRVYLPEQFIALRALVCPEGEESFARSLSRCVQWAARGGKSGSAFLKTRDDRFVLKEMTQHEVQLFLVIAPHYLRYIQRALEGGQPTLLGKIVGVYRVGYRGVTGTAGVGTSTMKTNFLVMENLFYGRTITQRFDLKGSMRNRLVETNLSTQGGEIVLLDENLLKMTCDSPLYIHPHSKLVLTLAIEKDTQFLASQAVMDYSLLVGLDEEKRELVLGIIDYVRTFTWDKKLETMVKSSGILGGQGKLPTIVSPELYQSRFIAAMHRYFLPVPDRWTGLGKGVDC